MSVGEGEGIYKFKVSLLSNNNKLFKHTYDFYMNGHSDK